MTKKKATVSAPLIEKTAEIPPVAGERTTTSTTALPARQPVTGQPTQPRTAPPTLVICRNKHWRYISSYHGPWLTLPPEVLESLAVNNYYSPRPRPIDPAVFFDLVKIRRLIDDATSLAVRAANGTTSSSLQTSLNATNGMLTSAGAEILGLGLTRGGGNAPLSRERRHRMREHATQKLSRAYHLDEIAASVATMQSASPVADVARHVLQRNHQDADAQYVHFFHEKIPSMSIEYTSLDPLDQVIRQNPTEASPYRTRAVARVFKDDFEGAARDCTEGLAVFKLYHRHENEQRDLILAKDAARLAPEYRADARVEEKDQPSSLEPQLLFHRGSAYLTLACDNIGQALHGISKTNQKPKSSQQNGHTAEGVTTDVDREDAKHRAEARKLVRTYAKRALRDYMSFLSHFDYTPHLSTEHAESFVERARFANDGHGNPPRSEKLLDMNAHTDSPHSESLVKYEGQRGYQQSQGVPPRPKSRVHTLDTLFAAVAPPDLPPFPLEPHQRVDGSFSLPNYSEAVTHHPLLTDVLHSLLLCHCLIQTSAKEHLRHAYMVARLVRVCDGYPIFLAARSPARADWIEVLRRSKNWLGVCEKWENLCALEPIRPAVHNSDYQQRNQAAHERQRRLKQGTTRPFVTEEQVMDKETFQANIKAQESRRAADDEEMRQEYCHSKWTDAGGQVPKGNDANVNTRPPRRWAQDKGREYPITMERAESIVRWITNAPPPSASDGASRPKKRSAAKGKLRKMASTASSLRETGLEQSIDSLDIED